MNVALSLLLKHWQLAAIVALVSVLGVGVHRYNTALVERGQAQERARVADSSLAVNRIQLARIDTLLVRDTIKVRLAVERVVSVRDTLLQHLTDTIRVKEYIARTDTALKACSELAGDCAEFRQRATAIFAAYEAKLRAQPIATPRSCTVSNGVWGVLGASVGVVGGYVAHHR